MTLKNKTCRHAYFPSGQMSFQFSFQPFFLVYYPFDVATFSLDHHSAKYEIYAYILAFEISQNSFSKRNMWLPSLPLHKLSKVVHMYWCTEPQSVELELTQTVRNI